MAKKKEIENIPQQLASKVVDLNVKEFLFKNYLPYAYYTIQDRALTYEDGLKPVQRRIIWTLWEMKARANSDTVKAQTAWGNVIGRYHPHGDAAVAEAGASLGKTWYLRVPLLEIQGNVGTWTGDTASAPRYYEVKLNKAGEELVADTDNNASEMIYNFSDTLLMPKLLPVRWPYSIINGGAGIATGYSSKMVPHNPTEVMDACILRLQNKIKNTDELLKVMKGPDFPTGGEVLGYDGVKEYFETGKGTFTVTSKYNIEKVRGGGHKIVFYELPYLVPVSSIITKIKELKDNDNTKEKFAGISEYKDLSEKTDLKFVISVKAGYNPEVVVEELFKSTPLQSKIPVNNTVLMAKKPVQSSMLSLIDQFLDFKQACYIRKTTDKVATINKQLVSSQAILAVLVDIDKAISIIRNAKDSSDAHTKLQKAFKLSEEQATYILNMRLQTLTKANRNDVISKEKALEKDKETLEKILSSETLLKKEVIKELESTKKIIGSERLTTLSNTTNEDFDKADKERKKMMAKIEKTGKCYISLLANNTLVKSLGHSEFDVPVKVEYEKDNASYLDVLLSNGTKTELEINTVPLTNPSNISLFGIKEKDFVTILPEDPKAKILLVSNFGNVNICKGSNKIYAKLAEGEKLIYAKELDIDDIGKNLVVVAEDGQAVKFAVSSIRESKAGSGLIAGMKYNKEIVSASLADELDYIITVSEKTVKITPADQISKTNRAVKGVLLHKLVKDDKIVFATCKKEPTLLSEKGKDLKLPEVSDRATKGKSFSDKYIKW